MSIRKPWRSKQDLAKEKLEYMEILFQNLEKKLLFKENQKIRSKQMIKDLKILEHAVKGYRAGNYLDACINMYEITKIDPQRYPFLTKRLKEMLNSFIQECKSRQLSLFK